MRLTRRRRRFRWLAWCLGAAALLVFGYLAALPLVLYLEYPPADSPMVRWMLDHDELLRGGALVGLVAAWCFMFGAAVGSFLNVVAYRMPRGESIVVRPSHCPHCNQNIALRDNLPVFGWFLLGGRCRSCRLPISPRYPLVEGILGSAFLILAVVEILFGGWNLPHRAPVGTARWNLAIEMMDPQLWGIYAYHCALLSFLTALALIEYDRRRAPLGLMMTGLLAGIICAAIWPALHVVEWIAARPAWLSSPDWLKRIDTSLAGLAAGVCLGALGDLAANRRRETAQRWAGRWQLALVGLFLGWQAAIWIAGGAVLFALASLVLGRASSIAGRGLLSGRFALAALLHLCLWALLASIEIF